MSNSIIVRKSPVANVSLSQGIGNSLTILKSGSLSVNLPPATNTTLGGVIVGDNLSITGNGVLSAQPGGVTAFNNRTGNVSLTSSDVTTALTTPFSCLTFTGTSAASPFAFTVQNSDLSRYVSITNSSANYTYANGTTVVRNINSDLSWVIINTKGSRTDWHYPFFRLSTDREFPDSFESFLGLYYNYTSNATGTVASGPFVNSVLRVFKNRVEYQVVGGTNSWTDLSLITKSYADSRYVQPNYLTSYYVDRSEAYGTFLPSANFTFANLTDTPATLAGYGITDGLTSANLTPYLTTANATATYAVLGHTHAIANVTGLQTALDAKLPSANFTYANLTGTPNLTLYLTTANAAATYSVLTHNHVIANVTGLQTALDSKLPSANLTYANLTGPQNLLDTELIRAKLRDYSETVSSPTISAGTLVLNLETSNIFTVSLNAAITTLTISNPPASGSGGSFTLIFTADGIPRSVTWPASIKWAGGTAPTITSAIGKVDSFAFFTSDGGTTWQGYIGGQNF